MSGTSWNEIPKEWNPDATPEEAEQMGKDFDAQIAENRTENRRDGDK